MAEKYGQIQEQSQQLKQGQTFSHQQLLQASLVELPLTQLIDRINTEMNDNPALEAAGQNPFKLDSKADPDWSKFQDFLKGEVRYASLMKSFPENAAELFGKTEEFAKWRLSTYKRLAGVE